MEREEIIQTIGRLVRGISDIGETTEVGEDTSIMDDLDMASVEIFSLLGEIEAAYHITVPTRLLVNISTVGDLADLVIAKTGQ